MSYRYKVLIGVRVKLQYTQWSAFINVSSSHCTETVTITIFFINDDTKHDHHFVANVTKLVVKYLLFFGSPGKGLCEAAGGVIKFLVRQAILGDKDILSSSAADIYRRA